MCQLRWPQLVRLQQQFVVLDRQALDVGQHLEHLVDNINSTAQIVFAKRNQIVY